MKFIFNIYNLSMASYIFEQRIYEFKQSLRFSGTSLAKAVVNDLIAR